MSEKHKFWKKTIFWNSVRNTIAIFTGPTMIGLHEFGAADGFTIAAGCMGFMGAILSVWIVDHDKNGLVDLFEDQP